MHFPESRVIRVRCLMLRWGRHVSFTAVHYYFYFCAQSALQTMVNIYYLIVTKKGGPVFSSEETPRLELKHFL